MVTSAHDLDAFVAENLRALREAASMSQELVATHMSDAGFGFTQATVWKIEDNQRPLKVAECVVLGQILGVPDWSVLALPPRVYRARVAAMAAGRRVTSARLGLKTAVKEYLDALDHLDRHVPPWLSLEQDPDDEHKFDNAHIPMDEPPEMIALLIHVRHALGLRDEPDASEALLQDQSDMVDGLDALFTTLLAATKEHLARGTATADTSSTATTDGANDGNGVE